MIKTVLDRIAEMVDRGIKVRCIKVRCPKRMPKGEARDIYRAGYLGGMLNMYRNVPWQGRDAINNAAFISGWCDGCRSNGTPCKSPRIACFWRC